MALLIKNGFVTPIGPAEPPNVCVSCLRPTAKWLVEASDDKLPWCASCFLYKTEWGKSNEHQRDALISAVESDIKKKITTSDGVLIEFEADRILTSVVIASAYARGRSVR